jgi:predicted permease
METLLLDLRYAVRTLVRARGFSIAVIVLFAIGIGATTAMFSVVDALLLRPLPYRDPDRMVTLQEWMTGIDHGLQFSPPDFHSFRERSRSFEVLAGVAGGRWTLLEGESPEEVYGFRTSAEYFQIANGEPLLGRTFSPGEGESGAEVVLSYGLWQRRFGSDPALVGRQIHMDDKPCTVIGVMPKEYHDGSTREFWRIADFKADEKNRGDRRLYVSGRLKPGVSVAAADAEARSIAAQLAAELPETNVAMTARVELFSDLPVLRQTRSIALTLFGAIVLLLVIACANIASLVLTRASTRTGEIAIAIGIGVGLVVAFVAMRVVRSVVAEVGPLDPFLVAGVTVLLALVATFASYVPARRATRVSPMLALRGD